MSDKFSIEVYDGWQIADDEMKQLRVAEVRKYNEDGKKQRKPHIKLVGDDDEGLFKSMMLWAEQGCPSFADLSKPTEATCR